MNDRAHSLIRTITLRNLALPVLTITLGLQTLRVFFPSLAWYLKDTVGVGTITLVIYAFVPFLIGFLAAILRRLAGPRLALWITAGGVALFRLVEQVVASPGVDLWLSIFGTALFVLFLPIFVGHAFAGGKNTAAPRLVFGILLGLALDSTIHGVAGTLDLSWISGLLPLLTIVLMTVLVLWLLWVEPVPVSETPRGASWWEAFPLLALGPYLLIQAVILQNQGWISEVAGVSPSTSFLLLMVGNLLAVAGAIWGFSRPHTFRPSLALVVAVYLGLATFYADKPGATFLVTLLVGQLLMGWGWAHLTGGMAPTSRPGIGRTTVLLVLSMVLFLLLAFLYYISLEIAVPIPRKAFLPVGSILFGLTLFVTSIRMRSAPIAAWRDWTALTAAFALAVVSLLYWVGMEVLARPVDEVTPSLPMQVMTYNIHSSYNIEGRQDPEAIARVIEASGADIIALQEVSRGWLIDGSTDLASWLAQRLNMHVLFKGTTGPMWGNAILTRYPIMDHGSGGLPLAGSLLGRGYLWVKFDVGAQSPIQIIATHLHHLDDEVVVRLAQVPVLIEYWDHAPHSVILGDLNARPGEADIDLILQTGLIDSWTEAGSGVGYTYSAGDPFKRIDWIWHTPDLVSLDVEVLQSTASDHLPVIITLDLAR
jgi:endonuclease/exonuclease/phosphatase family metal-dependent hydrolase